MSCTAEHSAKTDTAVAAQCLAQLYQLRTALGRRLANIFFAYQLRVLFQHGVNDLIHGLHRWVAQFHNKLHLARNHIDRSWEHLKGSYRADHIRRSGLSPFHKLGNDPAGFHQRVIPQMHGCAACMIGTAGNRHAIAHDAHNTINHAYLHPFGF